MIVGVFLRNIKTYKGINFIPLTHKSNFCGVIGKNGVGKSTILEGLDYVLNGVNGDRWNCHYDSGKDSEVKPYVVPVFLIEKKKITQDDSTLFEKLSDFFWTVSEKALNSANIETSRSFVQFREELALNYDKNQYYLIVIGKNKEAKITTAIFDSFNTIDDSQKTLNSLLDLNADEGISIDSKRHEILEPLWDIINSLMDYIYIPKDIEPEKMTLLETTELQAVMGTTVQEIIAKVFSKKEISEISRKLRSAIDDISAKLEGYEYKEPGRERESMLKGEYLYNLIKSDFFSKRKLHKRNRDRSGDRLLLVSQLSSGEKQQAIVNIYYSLIMARQDDKMIVLAIDEPESSLHVSACYEQFEKLKKLCSNKCQVIFTSHWYGFIPAIMDCSIVNISKETSDDKHKLDVFYSERYREQIEKQIEKSKKEFHKDLFLNIELKSINDFVQSIISSVLFDNPYNWILCEGTSDRMYLQAYFSEKIEEKRLRIVPVGGVGQIYRLYKQFETLMSEKSICNNMKGRILLLSDTDPKLNHYDVVNSNNLKNVRLVANDSQKTVEIVNIGDQMVSGADVEDGINGKILYQILRELNAKYPQELSFMDFTVDDVEDCSAVHALNLRRNEQVKLKEFFNSVDEESRQKMKTIVSSRYVDILKNDKKKKFSEPKWISQIRSFLFNE